MLLEVSTRIGTGTRVTAMRCWSDGLLFDGVPGRLCTIVAMSLIGPETVVKAVAAGCNSEFHKPTMHFRNETVVMAQWSGTWTSQAQGLGPGAYHLIAMREQAYPWIIMPHDDSREAFDKALYKRLLTSYSTPLIPDGQVGQPESEKQAGLLWRQRICATILDCEFTHEAWKQLNQHPDQPNKQWTNAGLLNLNESQLDTIVSDLVSRGDISIPKLKEES